MNDEDKLLTVGEAAELLSVSRSTVYRLLEEGEIPVVKVLGSTRFRRSALLAYIERQEAVRA